jgi:predicted amidohydrolase
MMNDHTKYTKKHLFFFKIGEPLLSILSFCFLTSFPLNALTPSSHMETTVVQFQVSLDMIRSEQVYASKIEEAVNRALAEGPADLLIFPEYLGVFASLIPWQGYLTEEKPFEQVWKAIASDNPELTSLNALFSKESARTNRYLDELWGRMARKHQIYILSGTRFSYDTDLKGLVNQAVVYAPDGSIAYKQNKYFLTEFEEELLSLTAGDLSDTAGFTVKDHLIRLTICRDTFLKRWESLYRQGDLWIDIKANGTAFTPDQEELFERALPARLPQTPIPYGITACLTGNFLNLLWEGKSSMIKSNLDGSVSYTETSKSSSRFEILRKTFP